MKVPHAVQIVAVFTTMNVVVHRLRQFFIENVTYELRDSLETKKPEQTLTCQCGKSLSLKFTQFAPDRKQTLFFAYLSHIFLLLVKFLDA